MNIRIFVYGTLMRGERAHYLLSDARYLGKFFLYDYAIYNLGSFPGIINSRGDRVLGEVYEITESMLPAMDYYEGEGSLYLRKNVNVCNDTESVSAFAYIYNRRIEGEKKMNESWKNNNNDYVWYAAYGSNINYERFMEYINRCTDSSAPIDSRAYMFKHNMYFAKFNSNRWNGAIAFLDGESDGFAYGKIYKITRAQFEQVKCMEGSLYNNELFLEYIDEIPVYTFTSYGKMNAEFFPSKSYMDVIFNGLINIFPDKNPLVLQTYLYTRGFIEENDIEILNIIRRSEHAIKVREICEHIMLNDVKTIMRIKELERCGLLKKDGRSGRLDITDSNALVYTVPERRDLVDTMCLFRH